MDIFYTIIVLLITQCLHLSKHQVLYYALKFCNLYYILYFIVHKLYLNKGNNKNNKVNISKWKLNSIDLVAKEKAQNLNRNINQSQGCKCSTHWEYSQWPCHTVLCWQIVSALEGWRFHTVSHYPITCITEINQCKTVYQRYFNETNRKKREGKALEYMRHLI